MKVVYLNPTGTLGGAELCLLDTLAGLHSARPGWDLSVILTDDGPAREAIAALGVGCQVLPLPGRLAGLGDAGLSLTGGRASALWELAVAGPAVAARGGSYLRKLRGLLRAARPDLVQTNGMKAHVLGAWAAPRGVPVVWHLHDYTTGRALMGRLLRASRRSRLSAVAVSDSVAGEARRVLGPAVPVERIYNAVDLGRFAPPVAPDGAWLDEAAGLPAAPPGTVRVGLVGTYARWKGHDVFLDAAAQVPSGLPARFYVIGGAIYRSAGSQVQAAELAGRADRLGLGGRVGFVAHQADPARAFRALDVVVHASTRPEPFGRVIVEGMACGRAVVAVPEGGAAELFRDGHNALACPPREPSVLAGVLSRLIADPALRRDLGTAGRREAEARFDRRALGETWAQYYEARWGRDPGTEPQ